MSKDRLDHLLAGALPKLDAHWKRCLKAGLSGHTADSGRAVNALLVEYFLALRILDWPAPAEAITSELRRLFAQLGQLNTSAGSSLLETDERELIVPLVNTAAELAGLDLDAYEDGDPTSDFRGF